MPLRGDFSLRTGFQFTDQRSVGEELLGSFETHHVGVKASLGWRSLILFTSATRTSESSGIMNPWGGSPAFNSVMISDFDRAGEKSFRAGLSYDFSDAGLKGLAASTSWTDGNTPDSGCNASPDQEEVDVTLDYRPPIRGFENLWFRARYAVNEGDPGQGGLDVEDFRVILNYSFAF